MFLMRAITSPGFLREWSAPFRRVLRARAKLILTFGILGAASGVLISATAPNVYAARVVIDCDPSEVIRGSIPTCWARSSIALLPIRAASGLDSMFKRMGFPHPDIEETVSKWIQK
jgi:hypothetical protein